MLRTKQNFSNCNPKAHVLKKASFYDEYRYGLNLQTKNKDITFLGPHVMDGCQSIEPMIGFNMSNGLFGPMTFWSGVLLPKVSQTLWIAMGIAHSGREPWASVSTYLYLTSTFISNAGIGRSFSQPTKQGFDLTFGTNHFGHFLLTILLLDHLKKSAPSRIVTVSSAVHLSVKSGDLHFSPGDGELRYPGLAGYGRSKLANILFTRELDNVLKDTGVTAYSLHPGLIRTNIFRSSYERGSPFWRYLLFSFASV